MHAAFDISVCCSLSEGFPNSVVEAMSVARPVVATNVGGIPDAVEHERTGLLVPPADAASLAAALEVLLADAPKRQRFGEAGRDLARERFGATHVMAKLEDTYEHLVREALV
jgi:glycosyltransferase involved in cell wall biosynthesis